MLRDEFLNHMETLVNHIQIRKPSGYNRKMVDKIQRKRFEKEKKKVE